MNQSLANSLTRCASNAVNKLCRLLTCQLSDVDSKIKMTRRVYTQAVHLLRQHRNCYNVAPPQQHMGSDNIALLFYIEGDSISQETRNQRPTNRKEYLSNTQRPKTHTHKTQIQKNTAS